MSGAKLEALAPQRLQVNAAIATVQLAYGGQLIVETTDLTALAFKVCLIVVHAPWIVSVLLRLHVCHVTIVHYLSRSVLSWCMHL